MIENDMDLATLEAVRERLTAEQDINAAMTVDGMISAARIAQAGSTEDSKFEFWWNDTGQYLRAGGGDYEKVFAYHAFKDGREELRTVLASVRVTAEQLGLLCAVRQIDQALGDRERPQYLPTGIDSEGGSHD